MMADEYTSLRYRESWLSLRRYRGCAQLFIYERNGWPVLRSQPEWLSGSASNTELKHEFEISLKRILVSDSLFLIRVTL